MANAMVLGMGGVGCVIAQKLHGYECFERIILADIDTTFANVLHERTKKSRFVVHQVNATDTAHLAQFLKEHKIDVTLNACPCMSITRCSKPARWRVRIISTWRRIFIRRRE